MKINEYEVLNDYHVIEKCNHLVQLDYISNWGEAQFILMDMYLSLINSRDPSTKKVVFPKADYEKYKRILRVKPNLLEKELAKLMIPVRLPEPTKDPKEFLLRPLFIECGCTKAEDGAYYIHMTCDDEMMDYFFNLSNVGYYKYRLGMMRNLNPTARYLYNHLRKNKYVRRYYLDLESIRAIMHLKTKNFRNANEIVRKLKESVKLINQNTDLQVSFHKKNTPNHKLCGIEFEINNAENKFDEELNMYIAAILDISFDQAIPVTKAAAKNNLDEAEVAKRLNYIKNKSNTKIQSIIGYSIRLFDDKLWQKIEKTYSSNKLNSIHDGTYNVNDINSDEFLHEIHKKALSNHDDF